MTVQGRPRIDVYPSADALAAAAAERFVAAAVTAIDATGRFAVALSGGSTPAAFYALLAREPYNSRVEWSRVEWFWGDERCVAPDDAASNYRLAREALLDRVEVSRMRVHRIRGEDDPAATAAGYETTLRSTFNTPMGPPRSDPGARFDLVLLGLGGDGHTASMFPHLSAVQETRRWVMAEYVPAESMWRVTLTPVIINASAGVAFLVAGGAKSSVLRRVLEGPVDTTALPAQAVAPADGTLTWLVDAAAAAELSTSVAR